MVVRLLVDTIRRNEVRLTNSAPLASLVELGPTVETRLHIDRVIVSPLVAAKDEPVRVIAAAARQRGMTFASCRSRVMSSPTFTVRANPQQVHEVGALLMTYSRGRCSGNGFRASGCGNRRLLHRCFGPGALVAPKAEDLASCGSQPGHCSTFSVRLLIQHNISDTPPAIQTFAPAHQVRGNSGRDQSILRYTHHLGHLCRIAADQHD